VQGIGSRIRVLAGLVVCAAPIPAPADPAPAQRAQWLMGTFCSGQVYAPGPEAAEAALASAFDRIAAAEALLSTWRDDSELALLNRRAASAPVPVSAELAAFLGDALRLAATTGGTFDPTVGALIDLWDLRGAGRVPAEAEIDRARRAVGYAHVHLDGVAGTVRFHAPSLWIDSGGVGKGFALDRAAAVLRASGAQAALLDFGGQLLAVGSPPGEPAWAVAVADPDHRDQAVLLLALRDASAATSAQSERGRDLDGRWVGHILDPRTARPVERGGSVTVVTRSATDADALATALFVMGPERGLRWIEGREGIGVGFLERVPGEATRLRLRANRLFCSLVLGRRDSVEAAPACEGALPGGSEPGTKREPAAVKETGKELEP
jgi:thiamine biosynthesis lipoprotein